MAESVVVLAPHADDETLGAGGTIAKHVHDGDEVTIVIATGSGPGTHPIFDLDIFATVQREAQEAASVLGTAAPIFLDLPAVTFPDEERWKINRSIGSIISDVQPTALYVPFPYDLHNDHRSLYHAASVAWRSNTDVGRRIKTVLCYEVQSETHWSAPYVEPGFSPNVWVELSEDQLRSKLEALECYVSQLLPFPQARSVQAVSHLARWRGSQQGVSAAEAFVLIKGIR